MHLEKEMATHSSVLAWRIPGTGEPGGLPSVGLHRVRHDWSDLAAVAAAAPTQYNPRRVYHHLCDNVSTELAYQIHLMCLISLFGIFLGPLEAAQSYLEVKRNLFRIWHGKICQRYPNVSNVVIEKHRSLWNNIYSFNQHDNRRFFKANTDY